ncbi:Cation efflux system protein CusA [Nymphon striatum]|nr:Cation efflux system protein CusA [Nymphon striatum]
MAGEAAKDSPAEHAAKHADPTYICPMHPQIQQGEPGSCPLCGMDLVLKKLGAAPSDGLPVVSVSASTAQSMGVRIGKVRKRNMARSIKSVGYVQYDEDKVSHLHARAAGWIKNAKVKTLGDKVKKGQLLASYYAPDIHTAQENYLTALRSSSDRQRQIDMLTRLKALEIPDAVLRNLEQNAKITPNMPVTAPLSGVITKFDAQEGNYVTPGDVMYTIADLSSVWVIVDVFPEQASWIDRKSRATMSIDGLSDNEWKGRVDYVYPELDPKTRTLRVRIKFSNKDGILKPNMFANIKIISRPATGILSIPREALIPTGDGYRVVKVTEKNHYKPVKVKVGLKTDSSVEILEGLEADDQIVLSGQFLIDSENGTDIYWARARVLEYLSQAASQLPEGVQPYLGLMQLVLDGHGQSNIKSLLIHSALRAYNLTLPTIKTAIQKANIETSGSVLELGEAEYMVRAKGYLNSLEDISHIPVSINASNGTPILMRDIADISIGPQMRRGIADLDGEGEVVGGIVVMRYGENALEVIEKVKQRIEELKQGLPEGVEIVTTYDRSELIGNAVSNLSIKLIEEFIAVAIICLVFLFHMRSAFVAIVSLPLGVLIAFIVMKQQGINANIMSLGGIAIAVGAMVDAAIVMIENAHKHLERWQESGQKLIAGNFVPVFMLEAQEGRLFSPLAFTKTYAMAAAAGLSVTLIPVLMGYFIRGKIPDEKKNPLSLMVSAWIPFKGLGSEFMPELEEGDLLYMPTTLPGVSIGKAQEMLMQTDRLIKTIPEVKRVFGKIGRAETATDPAPLTMIETTILLKDKSEWRADMTLKKLISELERTVQFPGLTNAWVQPIKTRIDMLATGIKTPVGIKVAGQDLKVIEDIGRDIEKALGDLPGTASVFSERVSGGRYLEVIPKRIAAARYGLNIADIQSVVGSAVGGANITQTVEGLERYPVNLRYPRDSRDSADKLLNLPIVTPSGEHIPLSRVAEVRFAEGPPMIKTENARLNGWTFVDIRDVDLGSYLESAQQRVSEQVKLPAGYSITWAGQYEYLLRVEEKLSILRADDVADYFYTALSNL